GVVERRAALRGIPVELRRGHEPPPPLDPGRLAACGLAPVASARPRKAPPRQSAVGAFAVEAPRQPAPEPGADGVDAAVAPGMERASASRVLDPDGGRNTRDPMGGRRGPRPAAQAR